MVSVPEVVAFAPENVHAPPLPLNVRSLKEEAPVAMVFPPDVEVNLTSPELLRNEPDALESEPPISRTPPGKVTVPVATERSFVVVAFVFTHRQVPLAEEKFRL